MMPESSRDGNPVKDIEIHGEGDVWSTAQRQEKSIKLDAGVSYECSKRSVSYGIQCVCLYWDVLRM